jgi:hypothetical protein
MIMSDVKLKSTGDPNCWHPVADLCLETDTIVLCDLANLEAVQERHVEVVEKLAADCFATLDDGLGHTIAAVIGPINGNYRVVARIDDGDPPRICEIRIVFFPQPGNDTIN